MVEYGNSVSQVAGQAGGGAHAGGRSIDLGASVGQLVNDSVQTLSTMPPAVLLAGFVILVLGVLMVWPPLARQHSGQATRALSTG